MSTYFFVPMQFQDPDFPNPPTPLQTYISFDGITWASSAHGNGVTSANGSFSNWVSPTPGIIYDSIDQIWVVATINTVSIIAGHPIGPSGIFTSLDGLNFVQRLTIDASNPDAIQAVNVARNGSMFGSLFQDGTFYTSPDAITWTKIADGPNGGNPSDNMGVMGNLYIAYMEPNAATPCFIVSSPDGITWTNRYEDTPGDILQGGIMYFPSLAIAVGQEQLIVTSPDGITWTERFKNAGATATWETVGWDGGNTYVVAGNYDALVTPTEAGIMSSTDGGITWVQRTIANDPGTLSLSAIAHSSTLALWVIAATDGTNLGTVTSSDGVTWTWNVVPNIKTAQGGLGRFQTVATNGSIFVGVAGNPVDQSVGGVAFSSTDGVTWTERQLFQSELTAGGASAPFFPVTLGGAPIPLPPFSCLDFEIQTPSREANPRQTALVNRWFIDCDLAGQMLTPTVLVDNQEIALAPITNSQRGTIEIASQQYGRLFALRLTGCLTQRIEIFHIHADMAQGRSFPPSTPGR